MESGKGRMYVFSLMATIFVLIIFVVIVTLTGSNKAINSHLDMLDNSERLDRLYWAQIFLEKTRTDSRDLILAVNSEDLLAIEQIKNKLEEHKYSLNDTLNSYIETLTDNEQVQLSQHILALISEYNNQLSRMAEAAMVNDQEAMQAEVIYVGDFVIEIGERLTHLCELNKMNTMVHVDRYHQTANTHSVILIVWSIMAVVIIVIISIKILNILPGEHNEQQVISYVKVPDKGKNADTLLTELDRCISDLKVVAYDLSKSAKNIEK